MKFRISREYEGTRIKVLFDDLGETGLALQNLRGLIRHMTIDDAQRRAERLWVEEGGNRGISNQITDSGERVALSLLARWPEPVRNSDIVSDTGLSRAGVYDNLTGRRGDKGDWFTEINELYILTRKGEDSVIDIVMNLTGLEE